VINEGEEEEESLEYLMKSNLFLKSELQSQIEYFE